MDKCTRSVLRCAVMMCACGHVGGCSTSDNTRVLALERISLPQRQQLSAAAVKLADDVVKQVCCKRVTTPPSQGVLTVHSISVCINPDDRITRIHRCMVPRAACPPPSLNRSRPCRSPPCTRRSPQRAHVILNRQHYRIDTHSMPVLPQDAHAWVQTWLDSSLSTTNADQPVQHGTLEAVPATAFVRLVAAAMHGAASTRQRTAMAGSVLRCVAFSAVNHL